MARLGNRLGTVVDSLHTDSLVAFRVESGAATDTGAGALAELVSATHLAEDSEAVRAVGRCL